MTLWVTGLIIYISSGFGTICWILAFFISFYSNYPTLLQIFVVLGVVLGTIIYRLSLVTIIYGSQNLFLKNHAKIVTSVSAALINLVFIMSLTRVSSILNTGCPSTRCLSFDSTIVDISCLNVLGHLKPILVQ